MSNNGGNRIWQLAVLLLVLCNMGLILTMWLKPHREGPPGGGPHTRERIIRDLKLTDDQVKKYDPLIHEHQQQMNKLRNEGNEYRQLLFTNLKNGAAGAKTADSLEQLIAANQKMVEMVTYEHFGKVRDLCNDEQKSEFDKIIGDVARKMNGPGGHRPPPGDGWPGNDHDGPTPPPGDRPDPPPPDDRPAPSGPPDGH